MSIVSMHLITKSNGLSPPFPPSPACLPPSTLTRTHLLWLPSWEKFTAGLHHGPFRTHCGLRVGRLGRDWSLRSCWPTPKGVGAAGPLAEGDCPGRRLAHWSSRCTVTASCVPLHGVSKRTQEGPGSGRPASAARAPAPFGWSRAARGSHPWGNAKLSIAEHGLLRKCLLALGS